MTKGELHDELKRLVQVLDNEIIIEAKRAWKTQALCNLREARGLGRGQPISGYIEGEVKRIATAF